MIRVGLTGNMGSGKSLISRFFEILGVPVYHADQQSRKFLDELPVIQQIAGIFGNGVLDHAQKIDRKILAGIVFSDPSALRTLNDLLHPLVKQDFSRWASQFSQQKYILHEAAIIFESGFRGEFDYIIHVSCPPEMAIERVVLRDGISREDVLRRMQFQMDEKEKAALSDFVIRNDGSELIIPQMLEIDQLLSEIGA